ncbi:phosphatase PAP2 family protein [Mariprofundus sp. KV]|uniref:phosphatase PAP2 family protein n=1 Tax=Mariprofundus sp. KV TaxID=2608715 RepID=UPI001F50E2EE|nr:phosphatase PAP2 family protein [Mariprofundus sp. KV]
MSSVIPMPDAADAYPLFRLINDAHSPLGDQFFGIATGLGDGLIVSLLCSLLILFHMRAGIASLAAFIISGLVAQMLKRAFDMPRPPALLDNVHVLGQSLSSHSFPSGHATSDGVMVLLAFIIWSRADWRSWGVATLFFLAAVGRIYVGVHFPVDVAVGLFIGMVTMWLCWRWSARLPVDAWLQSAWSWKVPALIVVAQAAVLGLGYHVQPATAQPLALILPLLSLLLLAQVCKQRLAHE